MKLKFTLLALVMAYFCRDGARGQSLCVTQFTQVTATGVSATIDNRFTMCSLWIATYNTTGFTAISIELDTANDVAGVPGAFALSAGTVLAGANPSTTLNKGQFIINGYAPWVRLNFSSKTGTGSLTALATGSIPPSPVIAVISGSISITACTLATPCLEGGLDSAGAAITPFQIGTLAPVIFDVSASGNTLLVAASGTTRVRILKFSAIDVAGGQTFQLKQGTGATCGTGTTNLGMVYTGILSVTQDYNSNNSPLIALAGNGVCLNLSNATRVTGEVQSAQY